MRQINEQQRPHTRSFSRDCLFVCFRLFDCCLCVCLFVRTGVRRVVRREVSHFARVLEHDAKAALLRRQRMQNALVNGTVFDTHTHHEALCSLARTCTQSNKKHWAKRTNSANDNETQASLTQTFDTANLKRSAIIEQSKQKTRIRNFIKQNPSFYFFCSRLDARDDCFGCGLCGVGPRRDVRRWQLEVEGLESDEQMQWWQSDTCRR